MSEPRDTENWAKPVEAFQVGEGRRQEPVNFGKATRSSWPVRWAWRPMASQLWRAELNR